MLNTDNPFDVNNRAYQRFLTLTSDHFEVVGWDNATTGRPTMILIDLGSRDAVSLALLDTAEDRRPQALLAATTTAALSLHGPIPGRAAAADYALHLAMHDADIAATTPVALHHPNQPHISPDEWLSIPAEIAAAARTSTLDSTAVALVLLDHDRSQLTVVGPLASISQAEAWQPAADGWPPVDRLLLAVQPPRTPDRIEPDPFRLRATARLVWPLLP
ncbi:hypothetical protein M2302_006279 [Micromonospora sp. A200]|uniref:hypothetical protein n=1 Tax=Micromonospora sp. A200 TaxID=2940568 RepID=UPI002475C000|nr:hypothetical protein [Micromonospora sp. A200]MDH6466073.1 hypothetical protein [Micromonospora sp. A200]